MDDQEYLEPGFDPSTLTVPRLRSVLVAHDVDYPSTAKKSQLIEIFNDNVIPRAGRLRAANARVKRTSRGIENVTPVKDESSGEEEITVRPGRSTAKTPRRAARARTEEAEEQAPPSRSTRHSTAPPEHIPRRPSSKHRRTVMETTREEPELQQRIDKRSRASAATPVVKAELDEDGSPFSNENVFQSGSSPTSTPATDRRRTTSGTARNVTQTPAREARRKTDEHASAYNAQNKETASTTRVSHASSTRPHRTSVKQEPDTTEDFTPEEQRALVTRPTNSGALVRNRPKSVARTTAKTGVSSIGLVLLATIGYFWSQEKFQVGYCGVGHPSAEIAGVAIPDWADILRPTCEPCPPHAYCQGNLDTTCEPGFVLSHNPLSLNGLLPFAPTCEADSTRARKIEAVKQRAIEELQVQNAKYECGEAKKPEIQENDLKVAISTRKRRDMSNEEFDDLWASALPELQNVEDITSGSDGIGNPYFRSTSLAKLPIGCAFRRFLRETVKRYVWRLVIFAFLASGGAYTRYQITASRSAEKRAKELAWLALDKLAEQASLHAAEPDRWAESFISVAQLRDDVLRNDFSSTRRRKIWEKVQKKVEGNANVRPMVREGRGGDVGRVWEWVGAVRAIESPQSVDRRRSSVPHRNSYDGRAGGRLLTADGGDPQTGGKIVRWQEQGPYY